MLNASDLETAIIALVDARIAKALGDRDTQPDVYSSKGPLPPGWSRRRFLEYARKHPRARRIGGKRGRGVYWEVDRADWEVVGDHCLGQGAPAGAPSKPAPVVSIDSWISAGGYRATRAAR